jgi:multidrug efflux system membrane fusion protein
MDTKTQTPGQSPAAWTERRAPGADGKTQGVVPARVVREAGELGYAQGGGSGGHLGTIILFVVLVLAGAGIFWIVRHALAVQAATAKAPRGPMTVPVVAATARQGDMSIYFTGLGSVIPLNTVSIHSRVDGQVMKINFTEGTLVKQGDVLVELDASPFQVQREQAEGQLLKDQAIRTQAQQDLERYKSAPGSFTKQQIDAQQATVDQASGAVKTDQATIDAADVNIGYCTIKAPLSGRIGFRLIDQGNIVHSADTTPIAVITQIQPITVVFNLPEDNLQQVLTATAKESALTTEAYNRDATTKISSGTLAAIDNQVDPATGTVRFKATFPNTDGRLYPSQFVNARLLVDVRKGVIIVPAAAVQRSPQSTFVYVVKPDNTVDMRDVVTGPSEADETLIAKGLNAGEIVVTDGVDKLTAGAKVSVDKMVASSGAPTTAPSGDPATAPSEGRSHGHGSGGAPQQ